jgi:hypothetical protein
VNGKSADVFFSLDREPVIGNYIPSAAIMFFQYSSGANRFLTFWMETLDKTASIDDQIALRRGFKRLQ